MIQCEDHVVKLTLDQISAAEMFLLFRSFRSENEIIDSTQTTGV